MTGRFITRGKGQGRKVIPLSAEIDGRMPLSLQKMMLLWDTDRLRGIVDNRMDSAERDHGNRYYSDDNIAVINDYFVKHDDRDDRSISFRDLKKENTDWVDAIRILDAYYPDTV